MKKGALGLTFGVVVLFAISFIANTEVAIAQEDCDNIVVHLTDDCQCLGEPCFMVVGKDCPPDQ